MSNERDSSESNKIIIISEFQTPSLNPDEIAEKLGSKAKRSTSAEYPWEICLNYGHDYPLLILGIIPEKKQIIQMLPLPGNSNSLVSTIKFYQVDSLTFYSYSDGTVDMKILEQDDKGKLARKAGIISSRSHSLW